MEHARSTRATSVMAYSKERFREYQREYRKRDPEKIKEEYQKYKEKQKAQHREYKVELRKTVMDMLGGQKCSKCGCNEYSILEVNHINGGGTKHKKTYVDTYAFYRAIRDGEEELKEYNVLCSVCNIQHYVEEIRGVRGHTVAWNK